jgi:RNase P/RNase MRP subunit p30
MQTSGVQEIQAKMAIASFASEPYGMRNPSDLCSLGWRWYDNREARAAVGLAERDF